mmetsp:Transcript_79006/g.256140  ORF Transcript_79006/g.256140 Transcript_79006/m.256140 type:complete len:779 (-) Transcript_79006:16-2352(-)
MRRHARSPRADAEGPLRLPPLAGAGTGKGAPTSESLSGDEVPWGVVGGAVAASQRMGVQRSQVERRALLTMIKRNRQRRQANSEGLSSSHWQRATEARAEEDLQEEAWLERVGGPWVGGAREEARRRGGDGRGRGEGGFGGVGGGMELSPRTLPPLGPPGERRPLFGGGGRDTPSFGQKSFAPDASGALHGLPDDVDDTDEPHIGSGSSSAGAPLDSAGDELNSIIAPGLDATVTTLGVASCASDEDHGEEGRRRREAAVVLQGRQRGRMVRADVARRAADALKIQRAFRGACGRMRCGRLRREAGAAVVIQRWYRSARERSFRRRQGPLDKATHSPVAPLASPSTRRTPLSIAEARRKMARRGLPHRCSTHAQRHDAAVKIQTWYRWRCYDLRAKEAGATPPSHALRLPPVGPGGGEAFSSHQVFSGDAPEITMCDSQMGSTCGTPGLEACPGPPPLGAGHRSVGSEMVVDVELDTGQCAEEWYYLDIQGREFGPYSNERMQEWWSRGHFPICGDFMVRLSSWKRHVALRHAYDNISDAFRLPPKSSRGVGDHGEPTSLSSGSPGALDLAPALRRASVAIEAALSPTSGGAAPPDGAGSLATAEAPAKPVRLSPSAPSVALESEIEEADADTGGTGGTRDDLGGPAPTLRTTPVRGPRMSDVGPGDHPCAIVEALEETVIDAGGGGAAIPGGLEDAAAEWVHQALSQLCFILGRPVRVLGCRGCGSELPEGGGLLARGLFCSFPCFGRYALVASAERLRADGALPEWRGDDAIAPVG